MEAKHASPYLHLTVTDSRTTKSTLAESLKAGGYTTFSRANGTSDLKDGGPKTRAMM